MSWIGPTRLLKSLATCCIKWVMCHNRRVRVLCACAPLCAMQLLQILYIFEAPDVSFPTQLEPHHLDLCSSSYGQLSAKRSGLTAIWFHHFFMSSPFLHAFSSFLQSNLCLLNLKLLNKHIKASNGIKVNYI